MNVQLRKESDESLDPDVTRDGAEQEKDTPESPTMQIFTQFQVELETKHDKYERIVKLSRDITIDSKRAIFQLQRIPGSSSAARDVALGQARRKLDAVINNKFFVLAEELTGQDAYQYLRAYSPGIQEFIEAESLYRYLNDGTLVSHEQIERMLDFTPQKRCVGIESEVSHDTNEASEKAVNSELKTKTCESMTANCVTSETAAVVTPETRDSQISEAGGSLTVVGSVPKTAVYTAVTVPVIEYMLGVSDLTGEVMRLAITHVSTGDLERPFALCTFLREIYNVFTSFGFVNRELTRKVAVMQQSLVKVETACYNLQVRGSEVPEHMLADMFSSQPEVEALDD